MQNGLSLLGMRVVLLPLVLDKVSGTFSSGAHSTPVSQVTRSKNKKAILIISDLV